MSGNVRRKIRLPGVLSVTVAVLLWGAPAVAQINPGKINGTVVDEAGEPVGSLVLLFTPADKGSPNSARKLKVNKKGKFAHSFFPSDLYKITLFESELFLKSMQYTLLNDSGLELESQETNAHPREGLPAISVRPNQQVLLRLVVADPELQQELAMQVDVSESRGPLKKMSELYGQGDMEAVVVEGDRLLAEKPDLGPALYLRGVARWKLARLEEAEADMRRAMELVPDQEGIHGVMATILLERGDELEAAGRTEEARSIYAEAAEQFAKNLEETPGSRPSLLSRASALDKAGMEDELLGALEDVIEVSPDELQAYFRLSSLYSKRGDTQKALEVLDRIPSADRTAASAIYNVAVKLYNDDDLEGAELAAKKAVQVDPNLAPVRRLLARVYLAQGRDAEAVVEIEKFLELAPDDPEAGDERALLEALKSRGS